MLGNQMSVNQLLGFDRFVQAGYLLKTKCSR